MTARYWLMKSEPDECSIDHALAAPEQTVPWTGVRNFQARNFMRDVMRSGDGVLFYHSSCPQPGIAGLAEIASAPYPDPTQFDPSSRYFDPTSPSERPRWLLVNVRARCKIDLVGLNVLRSHPEIAGLQILRRGNRLSITPVSDEHWRFITRQLVRAASSLRA